MLTGSSYARKKRSETAKQQDAARQRRHFGQQRCRHASEDHDGYDHKRKRSVVHKQPGQLAQHVRSVRSRQDLRLGTAGEQDRRAADSKKHRRKSDDREIGARPGHSETFTGPKYAERG